MRRCAGPEPPLRTRGAPCPAARGLLIEFHYVVAEIHPPVPPDDVRWVRPTPDECLTLRTSTGPNPGDPRFVVVARPAR